MVKLQIIAGEWEIRSEREYSQACFILISISHIKCLSFLTLSRNIRDKPWNITISSHFILTAALNQNLSYSLSVSLLSNKWKRMVGIIQLI